MTVSGVSTTIAPLLQNVLNINSQLDDLQRQLGTGQKTDNYAGLGAQSGIAVALNAQLAAIGSYDATMTDVSTNLTLKQSVLQQIANVGSTVQAAAVLPQYAIDSTGQTTVQKTAADQLNQILSALNSQGGNGYLFSGSGLNQPSVDTLDHILNGNGAQAGLRQVTAERNQADLGADGLGRLVIPPSVGTTVTMNEDAAGSPFGLKLAGVSSTLTNATLTGPSGSPATETIDFGAGNPNPGENVTFTFALPDGTNQTLKLQATNSVTPAANQFTIGATSDVTAANLQAALTAGVSQIGATSLSAASAIVASDNFFDDPPQRVSGSPPSAATSLTDGTPADTVSWYTGDNSAGSVRSSSVARIDSSTVVSYGTKANEQGIRWILQNVAALAATSYSASDPNAAASYTALNQRVYAALGTPPGVQSIDDIEASLANAQGSIQTAQSQHSQTANTLTDMLQSLEGVDTTTVGAQILSLQTSLSASLATTARLSQINLLTYLSPVSG
jgi:flagellar hook-associated protein 3 FlgL